MIDTPIYFCDVCGRYRYEHVCAYCKIDTVLVRNPLIDLLNGIAILSENIVILGEKKSGT